MTSTSNPSHKSVQMLSTAHLSYIRMFCFLISALGWGACSCVLGTVVIQVIAEYLQKIDPKSDGAKRDWVAIYDECANVLYQVEFFLLHATCMLLGRFLYKYNH